jgi:anti-anti-sigma regulatory factor
MTDAAPDLGSFYVLAADPGVETMVPVSECPCVVTILAPAGDDTVWIRLVGAVEMDAEAALDAAVDRVRDLAPHTVLIDLAGVTFAGSLLVHFLGHVHAAVPQASIRLRHTRPMIQFVLGVTAVDKMVILDDHRSPRST